MAKNVTELRDVLLDTFEQLINGEIDHDKAKEITNMSGKIISSAKVQMDYNKATKSGKKIDFLEGN